MKQAPIKIALLGDYNEEVIAHRAIPQAIELNAAHAGIAGLGYEWISTNDISIVKLRDYCGVWCVPASPYANMENVLAAIEYVRTNNVAFLGTCGGYQHAALEFARNALGLAAADNAEVVPDAELPLISALSCALYEVKNSITLTRQSVVHKLYGVDNIEEEYQCGFGVNADYLHLFEGSDMAFTGFDAGADPRILEIKDHQFFIGTAFQPERSALSATVHPVISRFLQSAADNANPKPK